MIFGVDTHKRSRTIVAADAVGKKLATKTVGTTTAARLALLCWAVEQSPRDRLWAIEDCRQLSRRLERDLLFAGERIVRVPPKLMAKARDSARTYGKSDPIDALAVARAALREPDLPVGRLDGPERELRLLIDHRENLLQERTKAVNPLRWHLHELDPGIDRRASADSHILPGMRADAARTYEQLVTPAARLPRRRTSVSTGLRR